MRILDRLKQYLKGNADQPQRAARLDIYDIRPQGIIPTRIAQPPVQPNPPSTVGDRNQYDRLPDVANPYDKIPDSPYDKIPDSPYDKIPDSPYDKIPDSPYDKIPDSPMDANEERYVGRQFLKTANETMRQEALRNQARPAENYVGLEFLKEANEAMRPDEAMRAQEAAPQRERRGTFGQELKPQVAPEQKAEEVKPEPAVQRRGTFGQPGDAALRPHRNEIASSILEQNGSHQIPHGQDKPNHQLGAKAQPSITRSGHSNL